MSHCMSMRKQQGRAHVPEDNKVSKNIAQKLKQLLVFSD